MTVLIHDNFNGMSLGDDLGGRTPSPTNTPGDTWTDANANEWESDGAGKIGWAAGQDNSRIDTGVVDMSVKVTFNAGGIDNRGSLYGRANDTVALGATLDGYDLNFRPDPNQLLLFEWVDGSQTQMGATISFTMDNATDYEIELEIQGTTIKAIVDGSEKGSRTNSNVDGTTEGGSFAILAGFLRNNANGRVDDFIIDDLVAAGNPWYYYAQQ